MTRSIAGYHQDANGDWVMHLSCGHNQHARHQPPFQLRAWVLDSTQRSERLGSPIECALCERAELPASARKVKSGPLWTETTMPKGLLRDHRIASDRWGQLLVHSGRLRFTATTAPPIEAQLGPGSVQAIPPDVGHQVEPLGSVRFSIDFFVVDRSTSDPPLQAVAGEAGDPACWASLLCPTCGAFLEDGALHQCALG